jgi:hypothetical protein
MRGPANADTPRTCMPLPRQDTPTTNHKARAGGPEETTRSEGARLLTHRHTSAMCECAKQVKCNSMWDRKKVGSHSLAPVHCDSAAITEEHLTHGHMQQSRLGLQQPSGSTAVRKRVKQYLLHQPWSLVSLVAHASGITSSRRNDRRSHR